MAAPELNRAQQQAVRTLSGPLLVLAGAGTGKTRVITHRIAALIQSGIEPSRILAMTFTNKAAREMRDRAMALLGKPRPKTLPEISTFHSWCVRVLRRHITRLGYPREFSIYDRGDQESLARSALRDVHVSSQKLRPGDFLAIIGSWKNRAVMPPEALEVANGDREQLAAIAYSRYQANLKAAGAVDFDDLLLLTRRLLLEMPAVRTEESARYDHLLIDEYQDTNGLQYLAAKALAERHRNFCVVGDDDQSIYGWRGAEVAHILNFQKDWPEATVVRLEENYRSREPILRLANTLIACNSSRHQKVLRASKLGGEPPRFLRFEDEVAEAQSIVREIHARLMSPEEPRPRPSDFAILFRTNEQPRAFELELRRASVPYRLIGGQSFYDRKEVRDIASYLRVLSNPADEVSLLRIINTPPRGIGTSSVVAVLELAVAKGQPLWAVLPVAEASGAVPSHAAARITEFRGMIEGYREQLGRVSLVELTRELLASIRYKDELERVYKSPNEIEARWQSVQELVNAVGQYESKSARPTLLGFLEEMALANRDDQRDEEPEARLEHAVMLMTLHSAKGLEFPHVYMVGMEEGLIPHKRSVIESRGIDEERRLCYVGVTRARETLTLTLCKARMKWGKLVPSIPSRFLMEMRGEADRARRAAEAAQELYQESERAGARAANARERKAGKPEKSSSSTKTSRAVRPSARRA